MKKFNDLELSSNCSLEKLIILINFSAVPLKDRLDRWPVHFSYKSSTNCLCWRRKQILEQEEDNYIFLIDRTLLGAVPDLTPLSYILHYSKLLLVPAYIEKYPSIPEAYTENLPNQGLCARKADKRDPSLTNFRLWNIRKLLWMPGME